MESIIYSKETLYEIASILNDGIGVGIPEAAKQVLNKLADVDGTNTVTCSRIDITCDWVSATP